MPKKKKEQIAENTEGLTVSKRRRAEPVDEKIDSLDALKKEGYIILSNDAVTNNKIGEVLEELGLYPADLAKMTGLSRQSINSVMNGKMKPGIDFVLKVSYVLGKRVEELFSLTPSAWVQTAKTTDEATLYVDMQELRKLDGKVMKVKAQEDGIEYYDTQEKKGLTSEQYQKLLDEFIFDDIDNTVMIVKEELENQDKKVSDKILESIAKRKLIEEFEKRYIPRYQKLVKPTTPLVYAPRKK